ncbi:MAG TPA: hypothetical protein VFS05_07700 [Gemmatimonadaceae bacterium]|nr:hypothetical protein [Gemmatimonadaceae bacterium]
MSRTRTIAGYGAAALSLAYAGWVAATWARYGRSGGRAARRERGALIDRFLPDPEVAERHETRVRAPAEVTFAAAREMDLDRSGFVRAIFAVRTVPSRLRGELVKQPARRSFLEQTRELGWGVLAEEPERAIVLGAVTKPWEGVVHFRALPPAEFAAFREPGWAKIAWTLEAEPVSEGESIFRTRTRVATTDPRSRARFRRYWAAMSPGILLIRRVSLRLVRREAERRWRARWGERLPA